MQREILEKTEASNLRVYTVWLPILGGTQRSADVSHRVLPDSRVVHYWDGAAVTSAWFADNVEDSAAPAWDVYYVYGPDARWTEVPGPLNSSGRTIIGRSPELKKATSRLLQAVSSVS